MMPFNILRWLYGDCHDTDCLQVPWIFLGSLFRTGYEVSSAPHRKFFFVSSPTIMFPASGTSYLSSISILPSLGSLTQISNQPCRFPLHPDSKGPSLLNPGSWSDIVLNFCPRRLQTRMWSLKKTLEEQVSISRCAYFHKIAVKYI